MILRELIDEEDLTLIIELLDKEAKRLKRLADAPIKGYGSVESQMRKQEQREKAEEWFYDKIKSPFWGFFYFKAFSSSCLRVRSSFFFRNAESPINWRWGIGIGCGFVNFTPSG